MEGEEGKKKERGRGGARGDESPCPEYNRSGNNTLKTNDRAPSLSFRAASHAAAPLHLLL